jgi:hypothetical protein
VQTFIEFALLNPSPDRFDRRPELSRQLGDVAPGLGQLDDSPTIFRRIWWMISLSNSFSTWSEAVTAEGGQSVTSVSIVQESGWNTP